MSDSTVLKEPLADYPLWELPNFGSNTSSFQDKAEEEEHLVWPTAAEISAIQQQAHDEGYQAGHTAGHAEGHAEGHEAGYQAAYAEGAQRMSALMLNLEQAIQQTDQAISQTLIDLALEIAQQMTRQTLKTKPEVLLNTIREAIGSLPHVNHGAHLLLNPDDATIVRNGMGEQLAHNGWKIYEDASIERGGVKIETSHSQIDATVANRWQRIVASIGQDSSWIQE